MSLAVRAYVVPAVSKVTPLKLAVPEDSVAVMVAELLLENVLWGEPEAIPSSIESVELLARLPFESLAVTVTAKPLPAV